MKYWIVILVFGCIDAKRLCINVVVIPLSCNNSNSSISIYNSYSCGKSFHMVKCCHFLLHAVLPNIYIYDLTLLLW